MIVQCPYCATSYQLDPGRLTGANPTLKCSRCRQTFPAPSSKKRPPVPRSSAGKPISPADETLTLPFEPSGWKDTVTREPDASPADDLTVAESEEEFTLGTEEPADELTVPDSHTRGTARTPAVASADDPEDPALEHDLDDDAESRERTDRASGRSRSGRERSSIGALLIFLGVVAGGYGVLARALFASPALSDRFVGRLPLIGRMSGDRLLTRKVALSEVVGNYQRIKDGKEVFVITGKALNTAGVALHGVQIAGELYNGARAMLDQKTIYCGNVISTKVLKDLTPRELSILQKLNPPKQFMIEPGESSTFVIVFMDPPRDAVEFTTRAVAAQRHA